jgi:diamine N-acetyltransferase
MKSPDKINLRDWLRDDFKSVKNILLTTWRSTYTFIPEEDILYHYEKFYCDTELEKLFISKFVKGIIAEVNSIPAGWMKLYEIVEENRFYISSLYILPQHQGIGLGKKLLSRAYNIAKKKNYDNIWLGVMKQNKRALEWYQEHGFVFIEEEPFQMGKTNVIHLIGYKSLT